MAVTNVRGRQLKDDDVLRQDLNTTTAGSAVVRKVVQGTGLSFSSTGVDAGTGDVTITLATSGVTAGTYGSSTVVPVVTIDQYGRITSVATATITGGGGEGVLRYQETFTAIQGQTVVTTTNAVTGAFLDVYVNGVRLNTSSYTASGANTITLVDGLSLDDIVDVIIYTVITGSIYDVPTQSGNSGKFLSTDGTNLLWATVNATGSAPNVVTVTSSSYSPTATSGKQVILADASSGNITINLPTAVGNTAEYIIKKVNSNNNTVIIDPSGSETIDGDTTKTILFQNTVITVVSNNTNWFLIA